MRGLSDCGIVVGASEGTVGVSFNFDASAVEGYSSGMLLWLSLFRSIQAPIYLFCYCSAMEHKSVRFLAETKLLYPTQRSISRQCFDRIFVLNVGIYAAFSQIRKRIQDKYTKSHFDSRNSLGDSKRIFKRTE